MMAALNASTPPPRLLDLQGLTAVVGLGKTGGSVIRRLHRLGARFFVLDSRPNPPLLADLQRDFPHIPYHLGDLEADWLWPVDRIVLSPGIAPQTPPIAAARARGIPVWSDIELFAQLCEAPVAAITGTNGKSTVTTLLGLMAQQAGLRVRVGGNLGTPALDLLDDGGDPPPARTDLYVLELSSFQLETTQSLHPDVACVLNISADHLDRHGDLATYSAIKQRIFAGDGWQILNADDPIVSAMALPGRRQRFFTLQQPQDGQWGVVQDSTTPGAGASLSFGGQRGFAVEALRIRGGHNVANALAALAMGQVLGLDHAAMFTVLQEFKGLPHRMEWVAERHGIHWFNDSKGTNVGATLAAIRGLPGQAVVILGGEGKDQDFRPLGLGLNGRVRAAILIGRDAALIEQALAGYVPTVHARDLSHAVALAAACAQSGDHVVLSPACASFDMFRNYEDRGTQFAETVRRFLV